MKALYEAIKLQLQNTVNNQGEYSPDYVIGGYVPIEVYQWNRRQFNSVISPTENDGVPMNFPCVMVEFGNTKPVDIGGGGVKCYDDLQVKIHLLYREEAPLDGSSIEESLEVFPFSHNIRMSLEGWYSMLVNVPGSGILTWNDSHEDDEYTNIYHLIHEFGTTWIDTITQQPVNVNNATQTAAQTVPQPIAPEITTEYDPSPYLKPL